MLPPGSIPGPVTSQAAVIRSIENSPPGWMRNLFARVEGSATPQTVNAIVDVIAGLVAAQVSGEQKGHSTLHSLQSTAGRFVLENLGHVAVTALTETRRFDAMVHRFDGRTLTRQEYLDRVRIVSAALIGTTGWATQPLSSLFLGLIRRSVSAADIVASLVGGVLSVPLVFGTCLLLYVFVPSFAKRMDRQIDLLKQGRANWSARFAVDAEAAVSVHTQWVALDVIEAPAASHPPPSRHG